MSKPITGELVLYEPKKHSVRYNAANDLSASIGGPPLPEPALSSAYIDKTAMSDAGWTKFPKRLRYTLEVIAE